MCPAGDKNKTWRAPAEPGARGVRGDADDVPPSGIGACGLCESALRRAPASRLRGGAKGGGEEKKAGGSAIVPTGAKPLGAPRLWGLVAGRGLVPCGAVVAPPSPQSQCSLSEATATWCEVRPGQGLARRWHRPPTVGPIRTQPLGAPASNR